MSNNSALATTFCNKCGGPVAQMPGRPGSFPEPRHIGVPGEPVACPE